MYPRSFNQENSQVWADAYKEVLKDGWDYDLLLSLMLKYHENSGYAPSPAWLRQKYTEAKPAKPSNAYEPVKVEVKRLPIPKEVQEQVKKLSEKLDMNNNKKQKYIEACKKKGGKE